MDAGLVKGEGFAVDASVIEADASRYHGKAPGEIDWSAPERQTRAIAEFLTALDDAAADRKPPKVISSDEFHLAAIVQNLKTLANHIWRPRLNMPAACVA
jgi:hypothetical protein